MSELRDRLRRLNQCDTVTRRYEVFEALVEAAEPEEYTCGECGFFPKHTGCRMLPQDIDDARFYYVEPSATACENFVAKTEPEHTCGECKSYTCVRCNNAPGRFGGWIFTKPDTIACERFVVRSPEPEDATIRELGEERDWATGAREGLLESRRWWKQRCMNAEHELAEACAGLDAVRKERDEAKVEVERLCPLAKIGELVWGMRNGTRLVRTTLHYWPEVLEEQQWSSLPLAGLRSPTEALRSIQEVGDESA